MPRMPYPLPSLSHEAVENRQTKSLKTASVVADAPKFISIQIEVFQRRGVARIRAHSVAYLKDMSRKLKTKVFGALGKTLSFTRMT
jgi:hypothetical protein